MSEQSNHDTRAMLVCELESMLQAAPKTVRIEFADGDYQNLAPEIFALLLYTPASDDIQSAAAICEQLAKAASSYDKQNVLLEAAAKIRALMG